MFMTFELFGNTYTAFSFADASQQFSKARDKSGLGASVMPLPAIVQDGVTIGHLSYNGRIWSKPSRSWTPNEKPIYDNRVSNEV